jgi:hypothetical protein
MKTTTALRKGSLVVAERRRGRWFAGKISCLTNTDIQVMFFDSRTKLYGRRSSKVVAIKTKLPFKQDACGPYGAEHASLLAQIKDVSWRGSQRWVVSQYERKRDKLEWHVGRILATKRTKKKETPRMCLVCFNNGDSHWRDVAKTVTYIEHKAPYVLSGPVPSYVRKELVGRDPKSPLPITKPAEGPTFGRAPPEVGQMVIARAETAFKGWYTGVITKYVHKDETIVVISFSNGKVLGAPRAVAEFKPISSKFSGRGGPYNDHEANRIWSEFGLWVRLT